MPGARLSLVVCGREGEPPLDIGVTDADGRASWPVGDLALPGLLRAEKDGFAPGDAAVVRKDSDTVVRLGVGFVLDGIVVRRADGTPVPGAEVRIRYDRHAGPLGPVLGTQGLFSATTRTGPDGAFRFPGLATPSQALLTVSAEGFVEARRSWIRTRPRPFRVELDRPLPLRVFLRDRDGRPLPGGSVVLGQDPGTLEYRERFFQFSWVPLRDLGDGLYGAEGMAQGWYLAAGGHAGYRPADAGWIGLREGGHPAEIVLEPAAGIRGRVVDDATGAPLAGAIIRGAPFLLGEEKPDTFARNTVEAAVALGAAVSAVSGLDGSFVLPCASPGDPLLLSGGKEGYWPWQARLAESGEEPEIEVRLRPLGAFTLRGRAVDEAGVPVAGAVIRWEGILGLSSGAVAAGPDGRFVVEGLSGGQSPVVLAPGFFPVALGSPSTIPGGDRGEVVLTRFLEVRGLVVDPDGQPVPGLTIGIQPRPDETGRGFGSPIVTRVVSADGGGNLVVPMTPGPEHVLRPLALEPWTGEVSLPAGSTEPFTLVVTPKPPAGTGVVRGRALREDGSPLGEIGFAGLWQEGGDAPAKGVQPGQVAPDGTFVLEGVPAGSWMVSVQSKEWNGKAHGVALTEGGTTEVTVPCRPWPKPDPTARDAELRLAPAGAPARGLTAWATEGDRRSRPFRTKGEELVASVRSGGTHAAWLFDLTAGTAAVAPGLSVRDAMPIPVSLAAAGRVLLVPRSDGRERWLVVRDASGTIPWSNLETSLPGVPGKGYLLLLPPGDYEFTLSLGLARRDPETRRVTVRAGDETTVQ